MPAGIKIRDLTIGSGPQVERHSSVLCHVRSFLNRGEEITTELQGREPMRIDLRKREVVAGLRKGLLGMRAGGRREIIVSPHLAYGVAGVPGLVPPNAAMRFEVELLEVFPVETSRTS